MNNRNTRGFTLIELLIAITVIGILSTAAFFGVGSILASTRDRTHEGNIRAIAAALEDYYGDNGEYPTGLEANPNNATTELSGADLINIQSILPELGDSNLTGPQNYTFFPYCSYTSPGPCPADTTTNWETYHSKQYLYLTTYAAASDPQATQIAATYGNNTGWGCAIERSYSNPGYVLAYRREADGRWMFYKSRRGTVTISNYSTPNPNPCTFSTL